MTLEDSSEIELKLALKEALKANGSLNELQGQIRAQIYSCLNHNNIEKPAIAQETQLVNELIREYLKYNGYRSSLSVFSAESMLPKDPMDKESLVEELGVDATTYPSNIPLLYGLALKSVTPAPVVKESQCALKPTADPYQHSATIEFRHF